MKRVLSIHIKHFNLLFFELNYKINGDYYNYKILNQKSKLAFLNKHFENQSSLLFFFKKKMLSMQNCDQFCKNSFFVISKMRLRYSKLFLSLLQVFINLESKKRPYF